MINLKVFIKETGVRTIVPLYLTVFVKRCYERKFLLKNASLIILMGKVYAFVVSYTGLSIPCPFRYFTGFLCPGCGITTFFLSVAHGNWQKAMQANAFLFYTGPFLFLSIILETFWPKSNINYLNKKYFMLLYLIALIVFGFYRNI
ncbi:MAG: DUF2752 domain-containing protein [Acidaminococcaceae bacterium]|nr:DUF2752 domain-containing protein [Acidaminococcaceae bacterium]